MEMKEFYYQKGIRVSVFNLDHKSVPFHKHDRVSDIMYCSKGSIVIELPDLQRRVKVQRGGIFQIPIGTLHRFSNGESAGKESRYALMQLGDFNIQFKRNHAELQSELNQFPIDTSSCSVVFIENRKPDIVRLADEFEENKPEMLSDEETRDVVMALRSFAMNGKETPYPLVDALV
ncbi:cupin domain-containing protein [Marinobacter sp. M3C]|jgi:hypothetical protein|uniref:cupin domain-containing protein n=1 Tax=unclassified Marinobacter TaxID=83889 RepID=UPI00200C38C1|nr:MULTISPECIES: cupin domain-containing protein [unclassified Marinobacter]MCL1479935.1 cupin domain-containing protein [Marinobacter sp.]UQG57367.1 cupin domain-containing protein [Marinobacter sp. M4C]UQG61462.1 cupin domain-containing protein [Marinobacter sp. M3C]UQG66171.1 cupin domain-containing protein [Marinobacter sp. M2C]UQG70451.1 cupin domain-containing protein [Marinobacter sp. M1C]